MAEFYFFGWLWLEVRSFMGLRHGQAPRAPAQAAPRACGDARATLRASDMVNQEVNGYNCEDVCERRDDVE